MSDPVLVVNDLTVSYQIGNRWRDVVRGVTLHIDSRQVYGLVGESGSGKSTLALAIMRYLAENGRVSGGKITLDGDDLLARSIAEMRAIWGAKISLVPQDPAASLNPAIRIGPQLEEIPKQHLGLSRQAAHQHALDLLRQVRIADAEPRRRSSSRDLARATGARVDIAIFAMVK